jgi:PTS system nitrogen regulatory IIA component
MQISEVMKPNDVLIDVSVPSKAKLLRFVAETAAAVLGVAEADIFSALQSRENLGSTGIGAGIAIPHAPVQGIVSPFALFVRLAKPIDFDAVDEAPVDLVCLILTPAGEQNRYLKLLSQIARQLGCTDALRTIRNAADRQQVYEALTECDRSRPEGRA